MVCYEGFDVTLPVILMAMQYIRLLHVKGLKRATIFVMLNAPQHQVGWWVGFKFPFHTCTQKFS